MKKRNCGIDLLRIVSMFGVVIIHILMHGKILEVVENNQIKFVISWFIYILAECSVNCYALVSGFVYFSEEDKKHKISNYIFLWFQVEFYSVIVTLLFWKFRPDLGARKELIKSFFPVASNQYWYFSAYTGVFFVIPLLNKIVQNLKKENLKMIIFSILAFSIYVTVARVISNPFGLTSGYSFLWLAILYIIGAYIKKYEIYNNFKRRNLVLIIIISIFLTWGWKIGIAKLTLCLFGRKIGDDLLISYISPTILSIAIAMLLIFANLNIKILWQKIIKFIVPAVFGVYLLHVSPLVFNNILKGRFEYVGNLQAYIIPIVVFANAIIIFVIGIFIDKIRILLFKLLKVDKLSENIEKLIRKLINKLELI